MLRHEAERRQGQEVANLLQSFIGPLAGWLDQQVDRRLVRTFFLALVAIVRLRHSRSGLLLSELGAHILSPAQAPAGTKRLSNLLLMVSLVYAFLLSLLAPNLAPLVEELLRNWCHRTGERYRQAAIPLSRLRTALSALWLSHPPIQNSG